MGRKKPTARDEENSLAGAGTGGKSKKKGFLIGDDEYSIGAELSEDAVVDEEKVAVPPPVGNKKKGKKGGSKEIEPEDENEEKEYGVMEDEDEDADRVINFSNKKKSKGKKSRSASVFSSSSFSLLGGEEDEENDDNDDDERKSDFEKHEELDSSVIEFFGKKKPSKSKKSGGNKPSGFDLLAEEEKEENKEKYESSKEENKEKYESSKEEDDDIGITFTGKKKKKPKKSTGNSVSVALLDDEDNRDDLGEVRNVDLDEQIPEVKLSGNKKLSKQRNTRVEAAVETGDVVEPDQLTADSKVEKHTSDTVVDTSKNKKKKKKGGKAGQEDEDLDKILAELDGAPSIQKDVSKLVVAPHEVKEENQPEVEETADKDADDDGPAAASKKKKKKKDKEKEKKAAAVPPPVEEKTDSKKVPKAVRLMQEALAREKEAAEKKKREEEERARKEEEERRWQEEQERLAEEKKRQKKEREKEKIQKKKQEGKYLTQKEKELARKREQARNQFLANAAITNLTTEELAGAPAKRPIYQKKKSKPLPLSNGATTSEDFESTDLKEIQQETLSEVDSVVADNVEVVMSSTANENTKDTALIKENGVDQEEAEDDEEEEEWDARSWDDADLKLASITPFADEEIDSEPELLQKKDIKNARRVAQDAELPPVEVKIVGLAGKAPKVLPLRSDQVEGKKKDSEIEDDDKNITRTPVNLEKKNKNKVSAKVEMPKSDDHPTQNEHALRSPICCIMGHVDTGKTKLLDCIRGTNVQEGEAGGITQQIGATYFPAENIRERTRELKADAKLNVPGLLVIDTPGHESFTNLRTRGSGLCDIAILVVDIMHGLEPQTIESLNLLKMRNTEFIVALNKVDRLYGWKTFRNAPIRNAMKQQSKDVQIEFNRRVTEIITQFKEQGLNTELYYKNKEMGETYSIVPTSAISGEGIPDMLLLLVQWAQKSMVKRLTYSDEVQCTVLEVKVIEGHGTTIDVVLVNGVLHEGDQIVVCGLQGPIVTTIRALLTPHPMRELRVKGTYLHHKEIKAAQGIKITGQGLDHAIAGTSLYLVGPDDDVEDIKESAMEDMKSVMSRIDKSGEGVYVQASTLGSLEALLEFLKTPAVTIPVSGISIGPVHKKDVMKASVMLEKKKEYATILAFDVKVTQEARELADELGVKIFIADIIYHLFDQFKAYIDNLKEEKKKEAAEEAVFPCVLKIVPDCVFNKKDPIVLGVDILEGIAKIGTPICVPQKDFIDIGRVASIENNHKAVDYAKKGQRVAIKIIGSNSEEQQKMFGRHFEIEDELVSKISRNSLDALKEHYAADLSAEYTTLLFRLKRLFKIP